MRHVVIAPDKFKGSLSAARAAAAIARGVCAIRPDIDTHCVPMADGGEGTVDAFLARDGWSRVSCRVRGPLGGTVTAAFAFDGTTAVLEMAAAAGLALVAADAREPLRATTYGVGELVRAALDRGARRIVVGIGGSATNDGGIGMLVALGARASDAAGDSLEPGGAALARLARLDLSAFDARIAGATIEIAADVAHPLLGPGGASAVFGPQKGASPSDVRVLDSALERFADVTRAMLGHDPRDEAGAGAAGGLGFGMLAYLGARLRPGVAIVAEVCRLAASLDGATYCFTGEGSIDAQTLGGKTVVGVAELARHARVPVVAFGGRVAAEAERDLAELGIVAVPIADGPRELAASLAEAEDLLERAARRIAALVLAR